VVARTTSSSSTSGKALTPAVLSLRTTNPIESLNREIKEVAKNKSIFPNDQTLIKQVYLAVEEAAKKWTSRHRDWVMICSQLMIYFGDRLGERV